MAKRKPIMVSEATHALIMEEIRRLETAWEEGTHCTPMYKVDVDCPTAPHVGIEVFLVSLIRRRQRHRERRRESALRRRAERRKNPPARSMPVPD